MSKKVDGWAALVAAGLRAVKREESTKWELGDLALQVQPARAKGEQQLKEYAEAIGVDYVRLRNYREMAAYWNANQRVASISWTVHRELMRLGQNGTVKNPRRFLVELKKKEAPRGNWTRNAVLKELGLPLVKNQILSLEEQTPEERVNLVTDLLNDDETLVATEKNPEGRAAVERAASFFDRELRKRVRKKTRRRQDRDAVTRFISRLGEIRKELFGIYEELSEVEVPEEILAQLITKAERVHHVAEALYTVLAEGGTVTNEALAQLIEEEA